MTVDLPAEFDERFLRVTPTAHSHEEVVAAFNTVERHFGRAWIEAKKPYGSPSPIEVMNILEIGQLLDALGGVVRGPELVRKIRRGEVAARSEALALYLIHHDNHSIEAEYEPPIVVDGEPRKPDFRVRMGESEPWTYIEVSRPDDAVTKRDLYAIQGRLSSLATEIEGPFTIDVVLHRPPSESEMLDIERLLHEIAKVGDNYEELLCDELGSIIVNYSDPERTASTGPGLFTVTATVGGEVQHPRLTINTPFSDHRANRTMAREADQLSTDAPGLIMLDTSQATRDWQAKIEAWVESGHPEVGGVFLFHSYQTVGGGCRWGIAGSFFANNHAAYPIPNWLSATLSSVRSIGEVLSEATTPEG